MDELGLHTNSNARGDFVRTALQTNADPACRVYIAVAFFTDASAIKDLVTSGCPVRLIVRLGFPTSAEALSVAVKEHGVEVRYFTDRSFHPKLFIFGTTSALVGSANLTGSALISNQEVVIQVGAEDPRLEELLTLFNEYWEDAAVLTDEALKTYRRISADFARRWSDAQKEDQEVEQTIGKVVAQNIRRDREKRTHANLFIEDFRKTYQECVTAFKQVRWIYEKDGRRKVAPDILPLRLEIDSFISFVRDNHAHGDSWRQQALSRGAAQEERIITLLNEWHQTPWPHLETTIVRENYPRLTRMLGSPETIQSASAEELFDALCVLHSFYDRFRHFLGGIPGWRSTFLEQNDSADVKRTLSYLLYGAGDVIERMADAIYNPDYKLRHFGRSGVQELVGWMNRDELPILNGRTTKILRYFGFDVRQIA